MLESALRITRVCSYPQMFSSIAERQQVIDRLKLWEDEYRRLASEDTADDDLGYFSGISELVSQVRESVIGENV